LRTARSRQRADRAVSHHAADGAVSHHAADGAVNHHAADGAVSHHAADGGVGSSALSGTACSAGRITLPRSQPTSCKRGMGPLQVAPPPSLPTTTTKERRGGREDRGKRGMGREGASRWPRSLRERHESLTPPALPPQGSPCASPSKARAFPSLWALLLDRAGLAASRPMHGEATVYHVSKEWEQSTGAAPRVQAGAFGHCNPPPPLLFTHPPTSPLQGWGCNVPGRLTTEKNDDLYFWLACSEPFCHAGM